MAHTIRWTLTREDAEVIYKTMANREADLRTLPEGYNMAPLVDTHARLRKDLAARITDPNEDDEAARLRRAYNALNASLDDVWPVLSDFTCGKITQARAAAAAILAPTLPEVAR